MANLRNRLPPLAPLIAFDAAARWRSFTEAASELNLTQAAVSQQIRVLEQALGEPLFIRAHRSVSLTPKGRDYHHVVAALLRQLADATDQMRAPVAADRLTIATDQSVAALWLTPRLSAFRQAHPELRVRLIASDDARDCLAEDVDIAILYGDGRWTGRQSTLLLPEDVYPVCSPAYLARHPIADTAALASADLLELEAEEWDWLNWAGWLTGVGAPPPAGRRSLYMNNYPLLIEAAKAGQGVALGWRHIVDDALDRGELVCPVEDNLETKLGYFLTWTTDSAAAAAFRDWAMGEV
ncbi:MAG: LysR substrate-binding domain-containing protein [Pikeienuella sp.]